MACCHCGSDLYRFDERSVRGILSEGGDYGTALSGLWNVEIFVFSGNGQAGTFSLDSSDGHSDCRNHFLFSVEPVFAWKKRQRNENADHSGDRGPGLFLSLSDVSLFSGQRAVCIQRRESSGTRFSFL